jgi:hypothetical protein
MLGNFTATTPLSLHPLLPSHFHSMQFLNSFLSLSKHSSLFQARNFSSEFVKRMTD